MPEKQAKHLRFSLPVRIEHWALFASFSTLALTGLVQKFAEGIIADRIIGLLGGIETVRLIHHFAAVVLMLLAVYHIGSVSYKLFVRRVRPSMLPSLTDVRTAIQAFRYNLRLGKVKKPQQGRYTFEEKIEYWAVIWGTMIMAITGFMMWNPIATTRFLPGEVIPAAKAAHGGEALLAVLAIIVWHLYHVHIRQFNKSMFTGSLSEEEMLEDHPLELADRKAGVAERPVDPKAFARRRRIFMPVYAVFAAVMILGIAAFVSLEKTAISTYPPAENVVVYTPLTATPLPTPLPTVPVLPSAPSTWEGFAAIFQDKCVMCHSGESARNGLDLTSYQSLLKGGVTGPALILGDAENSLIVILQSTGNHPGQLSGEELAALRKWIDEGAPEN